MKRVLSILVMAAMLMTTILPVMAEEAVANPLENLTRGSITKVGYNDATMIDDLMLDFDGITFTSSDPAIINPETGKVTRGDQTKNVILTAKAGEETKEFSFRVPGRFDEVGGAKPIPQPAEMIYTNDFSGTTPDAHTSGTAVQDGKWIFENAAGTSVTGAIVPTEDGAPLKGKFVYDFVLNRSSASMPVYVYFTGTPDRFLQLSSSGGEVSVIGSETTKINVWNSVEPGDLYNMEGGRMKVTVAFDTTSNTYDLWFNNIYVQSGYSQNAWDVKALSLQTGQTASSFYIDDLSVYYYEDKAKTFYEDSFDGSSLPANVTTSGATKVDGGIAAAYGFSLNLNESGSNIEGIVNVDFTIERPANHTQSTGGGIYDASGRAYFTYYWGNSAYNSYAFQPFYTDENGTAVSKPISVGGGAVTSIKVSASINTKTGALTIGVSAGGLGKGYIHGYAKEAANGVAYLSLSDNGVKDASVLTDIKVTGQGSYKKIKTFCNENYATPLNASPNATINLNDSGTDIAGEVNVDFTIYRPATYGTSSNFSILDENGKQYAYFLWWGTNNSYKLVSNLKDASGAAISAETYPSNGNTDLKVSVSINTATKAVNIMVNGSRVLSGYAYNSEATGVAKLFVADNDNKGGTAVRNVKCYGEGTYQQIPVLYHDDFDGSVLSNHVTTNGGEFTLADGKLTMPGGNWTAAISLNENKTNVVGKFGIETKLTRTHTDTPTTIGLGSYGSIVWYQAGTNFVRVNYKDGYKDLSFNTSGKTELTIRAEFNSADSTMSVWLNGYEMVKDVPAAGNTMNAFTVYTHNNANNKPVMDYFTYKRLDADKARVNTNHESFDSADAVVELTNNTQIANGKLAPTNTSATSSAKAYLKKDKSVATGKYAVEFTVSRTSVANTTDVRLCDANGKRYLTYRMWGSSTNYTNIQYTDAEGKAENYVLRYNAIPAEKDAHVKVEVDSADNSFSIWVNGVAIQNAAGGYKMYAQDAVTTGAAYVALVNDWTAADTALLDVLYYEYEEEEVVVAPETRPEVEAMVVEFNAYDEKVTILSPEAETLTVIAAAYAGEKLVSAAPVEVTLVEDGSVVAETGALSTEGADSVKIMLWSSLESVRPLYSVVDVKGSIATN